MMGRASHRGGGGGGYLQHCSKVCRDKPCAKGQRWRGEQHTSPNTPEQEGQGGGTRKLFFLSSFNFIFLVPPQSIPLTPENGVCGGKEFKLRRNTHFLFLSVFKLRLNTLFNLQYLLKYLEKILTVLRSVLSIFVV